MVTSQATDTIRVLLIDDDEDDYLLTESALSSVDHQSYQLDWASCYETGLRDILESRHDVYLIDYRLGSRSGVELIAEARSKSNCGPMIMLTGRGDHQSDLEAMAAGAAEYFVKSQMSPQLIERSIRYAIDRRTASDALEESEKRFQRAFADAPIGMALVTPQGRFSRVNAALCRMLGYSAERLCELGIPEVIHPDDLAEIQEALRAVLDGESETLYLEKRIIAADGRTVPVIAKATLIRDAEGHPLYFIGQLVDISDLHVANSRLRDLLRSKDELIASVSHELRTPLTGVMGFAEVLRDPNSGLSPSERQEMITSIARQGADLANIVEDLLTAAQVGADSLNVAQVPVDLRAQAAQVLEGLDQQAVFPIELSGRPVQAVGDPARVRQVLRNLVTNALRYGGDTRKIVINQAGSSAQVIVRDNGSGIPEDKQYLIFEPYQRAHYDEGLTVSIGLGLTVSRNLAKLMNGDLTYHRQHGETVFQLTLPLADSTDDP